jgi:hypothetical protein
LIKYLEEASVLQLIIKSPGHGTNKATLMTNADEKTTSSFLGSTAQFRPWPPPQNAAEFLGGFSQILFFIG